MRERVLAASVAVFAGARRPRVAGHRLGGDRRPARPTPTPSSPGGRRTSATASSCRSRHGSSRATGGSASRSAPIAVIALIVGFAGWCCFAGGAAASASTSGCWSTSYALYLLAVFFPQSSTFRILAPLFPLLGAFALPRARWYRWGIVVLFLALQVGWLLIAGGSTASTGLRPDERRNRASRMPLAHASGDGSVVHRLAAISQRRSAWQIMEMLSHERGSSMAAMKPRTGDGPMEAVKEGRLIIVRVPLEGGGRLVVSVNDAEAKELYDVLGGVVNPPESGLSRRAPGRLGLVGIRGSSCRRRASRSAAGRRRRGRSAVATADDAASSVMSVAERASRRRRGAPGRPRVPSRARGRRARCRPASPGAGRARRTRSPTGHRRR